MDEILVKPHKRTQFVPTKINREAKNGVDSVDYLSAKFIRICISKQNKSTQSSSWFCYMKNDHLSIFSL
jgi:hypothetical protein